MGCYDIDGLIEKIKMVMNGQPWCECDNNPKYTHFECGDCGRAYRIINDFIRSEEFKEWLKAREGTYNG